MSSCVQVQPELRMLPIINNPKLNAAKVTKLDLCCSIRDTINTIQAAKHRVSEPLDTSSCYYRISPDGKHLDICLLDNVRPSIRSMYQ
jgi:hypothetical protein